MLVVHPGTQHVFQLAAELHRLGLLAGLHTGFAVAPGGFLEAAYNRAPQRLQRRLANRRIANLPVALVHLQPVLELAALARLRSGGDHQAVLHWRNEKFQKRVPSRALQDADVIIGFDTSSWILARRCRALGKPLVIVQTIGHPDSKKVVRAELEGRFPKWTYNEAPRLAKVREAEQEEHEGATLIVVSSAFTRQTLVDNGVPPAKIRLVSHGVDSARFAPAPASSAEKRPFRFVCVGLVDARKGVPLLLQAWRSLNQADAELSLVGPASETARELISGVPGLRYLGSVPQRELPGILGQCDVFVFPSYFEGFGLVILQAMACGLPVITTPATAGPDLLGDQAAGWIIPTGHAEALVRVMNQCIATPVAVKEAGVRARRIAEDFSWQAYGAKWLGVLNEVAGAGSGVRESGAGVTPRVLLAHPGTQYSGRLARQLERHGALASFHTCFAFSDRGRLAEAVERLPLRWQARVANRRVPEVPQGRIHLQPWLELRALASIRAGGDEQDAFSRRNAEFQRSIPERAILESSAVIGFDTSSWIIGARARHLGRVFLLDQSIGHPRSFARIAARLASEFPDWSESIPKKREDELAREAEEHALANRVVVPSRFVARTLLEHGVDAAKIVINPFGVDLDIFRPGAVSPPVRPLRFVFAGSARPRKGLPLLLDVWRRLPGNHGAELWVVGEGAIPDAVRARMPAGVRFLGRLSQAEMAQVFANCHVFVFPSFFEGLAQVQIEAAACGLPVIGTDSSGCEEIVRDGETGYVLPAGDGEALYSALKGFIDEPEKVLAMRERLLAQRLDWSWDAYGDRWMGILSSLDATKCA